MSGSADQLREMATITEVSLIPGEGPRTLLTGPNPAALRKRRWRIVAFFTAMVLHFLWWDVLLKYTWLRAFRTPWVPRWQRNAAKYKRLALEWRGIWIKLGQFLSTRVDVLPLEVTSELESLRDQVPAEPVERIVAMIEAEFKCRIGDLFSSFSEFPTGSASLAQVHRARSLAGAPVVVKVLRPHIREITMSDFFLLRKLASQLRRVKPIARSADIDAIVNEFVQVTTRELDLHLEARNIERFAEDFAADPGVLVPRVHHRESAAGTLTMEDVSYIGIDDVSALERAGIDRKVLARKVYNVYLRQFFITYRIHADPHPGNIFVRPLPTTEESAAGRYPSGFRPGDPVPYAHNRPFAVFFVDFGMVVEMPPRFHDALREFVIGLGTRDPRRVLNSYSLVGVIQPGADMARIEEMIREQLELFWGSFLGQIRPDDLANPAARAFFDKYQGLMRLAPFQFQTEMLFMMRAMGILSGLTASLDPDFDAWEETAPFAWQLWQDDFFGKFAAMVRDSARDVASGRFPVGLVWVLRQLSAGNQPPPAVAITPTLLPEEVVRLRRSINKLALAIVVAGMFVAGAVLFASNGHPAPSMAQFWPGNHLGQLLMGFSFGGLALAGLWRLS
jgi:predicted unusual protein kinase regulating ubiquinone biosynthesis (AarF/ABC1/UbiB family)